MAIAVTRMARGNLSNVKNVGAGVFERVIDFGPGFRVYLDKDDDRLVIRLGGRTKKKQSTDIANAQSLWTDYKQRKRQEK